MSAQLALYIAALRDIITELSSRVDFLDKTVHELTIKVAELERKNN